MVSIRFWELSFGNCSAKLEKSSYIRLLCCCCCFSLQQLVYTELPVCVVDWHSLPKQTSKLSALQIIKALQHCALFGQETGKLGFWSVVDEACGGFSARARHLLLQPFVLTCFLFCVQGFFVYSGSIKATIAGETFLLKQGSMFIIPKCKLLLSGAVRECLSQRQTVHQPL